MSEQTTRHAGFSLGQSYPAPPARVFAAWGNRKRETKFAHHALIAATGTHARRSVPACSTLPMKGNASTSRSFSDRG